MVGQFRSHLNDPGQISTPELPRQNQSSTGVWNKSANMSQKLAGGDLNGSEYESWFSVSGRKKVYSTSITICVKLWIYQILESKINAT
jgi:hypothetical protein